MSIADGYSTFMSAVVSSSMIVHGVSMVLVRPLVVV